MKPKRYVPILAALAITGIGMELWLQRPAPSIADQPPAPSIIQTAPINANSADLTQLRALLDEEIKTRQLLQQRIDSLERRVSDLEQRGIAKPGKDDSNEPQSKTYRTHDLPKDFVRGPGFNADAMLAAGIAPDQVKRIQQIYDEVEMQKLYLRDQAVREGWIGQSRYSEARKELDQRLDTLRGEMSDKDYAAYLYATGQSNQVVVESTMSTSPAQDAGIQAGDTIIRYNSKPIYSWSDLRSASTQCAADTSIAVEVKRAETIQHLYIPCGPLGVRIVTRSERP
ncbi:MAG: PDZ domain-containing protein [Gammaproteobacteria bacterium]|nr:PDZ domain-containing protein [Gammaproteobacteria bacterium]MDH5801672.1 PDZ domain-containing protein [Gammaproteobacteria bacterium]